jgi:hypothetical protein
MPIVLISRVYRERQVMMMMMIWCRIPRKRATEREKQKERKKEREKFDLLVSHQYQIDDHLS